MLLECHNCGAPLDVADGASSAKCNYCGQTAELKKFRTVALKTPEDFKPPPAWTPPPGSSLGEEPLAYKPLNAGRLVARWIVTSGVLTLGVGGFIAWRVLSAVEQATGTSALAALAQSDQVQKAVADAINVANQAAGTATQAAAAAAEAAMAGNTVPVVCKGNKTLTITGKNLSLPGGTPVIAMGNCVLHLVACSVSGSTAVVVKGNATVTLEGGTLSATGPGAIVSENGSLEVSSGARLNGEPAVTVMNNASATIHDSIISASKIAIHTSGNASADATGSVVQGSLAGPRIKH
jgi:LSD1 subclass zinc finger protein